MFRGKAEAMFEAVMFYLFGGVALVSAIGCVASSNIVRVACWLLGALGGVAGLYFLNFANLLGAIQLIVYAGGTLLLIIFGICQRDIQSVCVARRIRHIVEITLRVRGFVIDGGVDFLREE